MDTKDWATSVSTNDMPEEDRRLSLMRQWCEVTDFMRETREQQRDLDDRLKEAAHKRDDLRRELIGYIDPDSLPQAEAKSAGPFVGVER